MPQGKRKIEVTIESLSHDMHQCYDGKISIKINKSAAKRIAGILQANSHPDFWEYGQLGEIVSADHKTLPCLAYVLMEDACEVGVYMGWNHADPDDDLDGTLERPQEPTIKNILDAATVLRTLLKL